MSLDCDNIENIIMAQVAQKVLDAMPEDDKKKILRESLANTLKNIMRPWNVEKAIEKDVHRYMIEYLSQPEVQERIKKVTHQKVDMLMDGVVEAVIAASENVIKSKYRGFMEANKKTSG